jgi:hypothetical protein
MKTSTASLSSDNKDREDKNKGGKQKKKGVSTSLIVIPDVYKEFKMEALRRDMEISDLLEHAMRLAIEEGKEKRKELK